MDFFQQRQARLNLARRFALEPQSTALLIIDMMYGNASRDEGEGRLAGAGDEETSVDYRFSRVENTIVPSILRLLEHFRKNRLRVIYVTCGSEMPDYSDVLPHKRVIYERSGNTRGNRAHEILDEIKPHAGEYVVNKVTTGAFSSTNIDLVLRAMGIRYVLFTGLATGSCVEGTCREAIDRGYNCLVVEDACGDWTQEHHDDALKFFRRNVRVETTESVISELSAASPDRATTVAGA